MKTAFRKYLEEKTSQGSWRILFPESEDERVLQAAALLMELNKNLAVHLYGEPKEFLKKFKNQVNWLKSSGEESVLVQSGRLLHEGKVDAVLAGSIATTRDVIRAAIGNVGLASGIRTVSGSFIMDPTSESLSSVRYPWVYADCGVVIQPTAKQLCDIASESVKLREKIFPSSYGETKVAFLSYSTLGSGEHDSLIPIREAMKLFREKHPDVLMDGEMQFDAAIDSDIGKRKAPNSHVAGHANCFIFPDLNSGNLAYKMTQRLGRFHAYGPILQGLNKPYSDLSRGATVDDIVASAMINLLRSKS